MRIEKLGIFFVLWMICSPVLAQNAVNVSVDGTAEDGIGKSLISGFREKINRSSLLNLVYGEKSGIRVKLTTLDPDHASSRYRTIYAFVVTLKVNPDDVETYLTSSVGVCGRLQINSCADDFKGQVDDWADIIRRAAASNNR